MTEFQIQNMTCGHCAGVVTKAVQAVDPKATLDFDLPIPASNSPSHDTGESTVTWMIVGTVDRPMRGDYTVIQWVSLHNG